MACTFLARSPTSYKQDGSFTPKENDIDDDKDFELNEKYDS